MRQVLGAGALGRPRGMGWRGKWEGGLGWGIHVNPWLIHVSVWQKPLQHCKVISFQLIKINEKTKVLALKKKQPETVYNAEDLGSIPWMGKIPWRRAWQPTAVFLPGESHEERSLAGYSLCSCKELETTEQLTLLGWFW